MQIVTYPDPLLRTHAKPVLQVGKEERRLFRRMLINMRRWNGVGLAAPQIGHSLRMIVAEAEGKTLALANPTILKSKGMDRMTEGCLSLPGQEVNVTRAVSIWVKTVNEDNIQVELKQKGLLARILQHEIDHLNGVLIIDHDPTAATISSKRHEVSA